MSIPALYETEEPRGKEFWAVYSRPSVLGTHGRCDRSHFGKSEDDCQSAATGKNESPDNGPWPAVEESGLHPIGERLPGADDGDVERNDRE